ncbi:MAG: GreA/GreB family elongation factor [Acidimicrobiales bacterium]
MGDLSENGDYHAAKEEQGKMEGRINHLTGLLENSVITGNAPLTEVRAGCVVSVLYEGDDEVEKFLIGSIEERRPNVTVMSPGSPMGTALMGAKKGDVVSYETPGGTLSVTVVDFEP